MDPPKWCPTYFINIDLIAHMAAEFFINGRGSKMMAENGHIYEKQYNRTMNSSLGNLQFQLFQFLFLLLLDFIFLFYDFLLFMSKILTYCTKHS